MNKTREKMLWVVCGGLFLLAGCTLIKAEMKYDQKQYAEAIPLYEEYLAQKPEAVTARNKLGFSYLKTGHLDQAVTELKRVLSEAPGDPFATLNLGLAYLHLGDHAKAMRTWEGFRSRKQPIVEEEIRRQLTLLHIAESQRLAKEALANERRLETVEPAGNTVAICYYEDLSPDKRLRHFRKALAAMVISDLAKVSSLQVLERARVQALLEEVAFGQSGMVDEGTAPRVGKLLGARNVVVGNLWPGSIGVNTTVIGEQKGTATVSVEEEEFYELPPLIVQDLAGILGVELTPEEKKLLSIPHTRNFKAFIYFGQALEALDVGNWKAAKDLFTEALKLDPKFRLAADGAASCPSADAPSPENVTTMTVSRAVASALLAQAEADAEAAEKAAALDGCFTHDTLILMGDDSFRRITDLRIGDQVQAFDVKTKTPVIRRVTEMYRSDQDHYYLINGLLKVTGTHEVFLDTNRWVKVSELKRGDRIKSLGGSVEIRSIERRQHDHRVYNFRVEDSHNYFVSSAGRDLYLVHNCK